MTMCRFVICRPFGAIFGLRTISVKLWARLFIHIRRSPVIHTMEHRTGSGTNYSMTRPPSVWTRFPRFNLSLKSLITSIVPNDYAIASRPGLGQADYLSQHGG